MRERFSVADLELSLPLGAEKEREFLEFVSIDKVDTAFVEDLPRFHPIGNGPETKDASLIPGAFYEFLETLPLLGWKRSTPAPFEVIGPFVTDQGNQIRRSRAAEVPGSAVEGAVAGVILFDQVPWPRPAEDCSYGTRAVFAM